MGIHDCPPGCGGEPLPTEHELLERISERLAYIGFVVTMYVLTKVCFYFCGG